MTIDRARRIAYFSMEIALDEAIPTYSGGLGILAGDTVRAAADLRLPMIAMSLIHRKGYFHQRVDEAGVQSEAAAEWEAGALLEPGSERVSVTLEGREVQLRAWRYDVPGTGGYSVPVYLLDADLEENDANARTLTDQLYGGDARYRLCQEAILGIGGVRMLRAMGYSRLERFHMNEGHASLLTLELLDERIHRNGRLTSKDIDSVRRRCVFTTHTPVAAGHDQFPLDMATSILGPRPLFEREEFRKFFCCDGTLNMTFIALNLSRYVNGVAKKHGEISRSMFPGYAIDSVTNGIHCPTWASPPFRSLFDEQIPGWKEDNFALRNIVKVPTEEIWNAHKKAKRSLLAHVNQATGAGMDIEHFTIGFARRFTAYKRPDLLFRDVDRLRAIAGEVGPIQILYAGKAHPRDGGGKDLIRKVIQTGRGLGPPIGFAYLQNYDLESARLLVAGVDLWLNTPQPPLEASGTSGMKAALNGVPSLSVLDGWWIEGHVEGVTGWALDPGGDTLYDRLREIAGLYYGDRPRFTQVMRGAVAHNASFFNTQRMLQQYVLRAYF